VVGGGCGRVWGRVIITDFLLTIIGFMPNFSQQEVPLARVALKATDVLRKAHERFRALFAEYLHSAPDKKREIFRTIKEELEIHARVEEELFYPAVVRVRSEEARAIVRNGLEEHQITEGLLAEIEQMDTLDQRYDERVKALQECVERHLRDEEERIFAQALSHMSEARLEKIGSDMEKKLRGPSSG
jgi:iron-sulfur cluster repair protein YtfE (RIC family)